MERKTAPFFIVENSVENVENFIYKMFHNATIWVNKE